MLKLLRNLTALLSTLGMSFSDLLTLLQKLLSIGLPPDLTNESELRTWIISLVEVLKEIAAKTPTTIDDTMVNVLDKAVNSSDTWEIFYKILSMVLNRPDVSASPGDDRAEIVEDEPVTATDEEYSLCEDLLAATAEDSLVEGEAGISPMTILAIIEAIAAVIRMFRKS